MIQTTGHFRRLSAGELDGHLIQQGGPAVAAPFRCRALGKRDADFSRRLMLAGEASSAAYAAADSCARSLRNFHDLASRAKFFRRLLEG